MDVDVDGGAAGSGALHNNKGSGAGAVQARMQSCSILPLTQVSCAPCALCRAVTTSPGMCWAPDHKWEDDLTATGFS